MMMERLLANENISIEKKIDIGFIIAGIDIQRKNEITKMVLKIEHGLFMKTMEIFLSKK